MAQSYITDAGALIIPGAYPTSTVQSGASGLATTGVIAIIGEADAGPDFTMELDLDLNRFSPDSLADVVAKYKTGRLVDAFRGAAVPANDPAITGAPSTFILVKTNSSAKASTLLAKVGGGTYGTLADKSFGKLGNLIYYTIAAKTPEVAPTTGPTTFISPVGTVNLGLRLNGSTATIVSLAAVAMPSDLVTAVNASAMGLTASGGVDRGLIAAVAGTLAVTATGSSIVINNTSNWVVLPVIGDTLNISATSVIKGASNQNAGSYVVTGATVNSVTATKLSDAGKAGAVPGTVTPPVTVTAVAVASTTADVRAWSPIVIVQTSATIIDGLGKSIEVSELTTGTDVVSNTLFTGTTKVTFISKAGAPKHITSAQEYSVTLGVNRQLDNTLESLSAGGQIGLALGYTGGTSCAVVVSPTTLVTTVVGGAGANITVSLKDYPTLNDLAAYISAQPGYTASVGSAAVGQTSPLVIDEGTFAAATTFGGQPLRLKLDAVRFFQAISTGSATVQLGVPVPGQALAGLPAVQATPLYLSGGVKGGTTNAIFQAAVDALQACQLNFIVPAFSRDATADIADGLTDSASTWDLATVHAYLRTHVNAMSTLKRRRHRQTFLSIRDTFANAKAAASNIAAYRCSMVFQDVKDVGANGIVQFQPWMAAAKAAGMQAAGFYRAIVNKGINITSAIQVAGDYKSQLDSDEESALLAGLLPITKEMDGTYSWVSDQTTYTADANFVYNSIQATYAIDTIALTTSQRMEKAFVGQSVADVSASVALAALEGIMADFLRLKLIAKSDDAPKGFKNAKIQISGPVMKVSAEIKLAGAIYFIPINFLVSQVTQSASS